MKFREPSIEYLNEVIVSREYHFAECARICYASDNNGDKVKDTRMYDKLWNDNHRSMYRHISRYYKVPAGVMSSNLFTRFNSSPYISMIYKGESHCYYISTNEQYIREHPVAKTFLDSYEVTPNKAFSDINFKQVRRYTFVINTGIDITRELNRTSPNNIAEQSTRYVDFIKKVGIQFKKAHWMDGLNLYKKCLVYAMAKVDEWFYKISRSKYGLNLKPQDARWCLFLDTNSKVAYTYSWLEWRHILDLRYTGTTGAPHPDAKIVAAKLYEWFKLAGY